MALIRWMNGSPSFTLDRPAKDRYVGGECGGDRRALEAWVVRSISFQLAKGDYVEPEVRRCECVGGSCTKRQISGQSSSSVPESQIRRSDNVVSSRNATLASAATPSTHGPQTTPRVGLGVDG